MPRRREVPKRETLPDPKYSDRTVGRFVNVLMKDGKKSTAEHIVYGAFNVIESKTRNDPLAMFRRALENVRPRVEVKSRRVVARDAVAQRLRALPRGQEHAREARRRDHRRSERAR
jgi:ribosomal protein S7